LITTKKEGAIYLRFDKWPLKIGYKSV